MHKLIGFSGYARSGKDYSAEQLDARARVRNMHSKTYALASPIKLHVNALMGWNEEHSDGDLKEVDDPFWGFSPRHAYQTYGTEWARTQLRDDFWVKMMERQHCMHKQKAAAFGMDSAFIITDVRFPNEYDAIHEAGGIVISVVNVESEKKVMPHASEAYILDIRDKADYVIENNWQVDPEAAKESLLKVIQEVTG